MSQPLIMSFRKNAADLCFSGCKRETRRIWKPNYHKVWSSFKSEGGKVVGDGPLEAIFSTNGRKVWKVGDSITIKRTRTGKGVGKVMCTHLEVEPVQDITEWAARREGILPAGPYWENGDDELYDTARDAFKGLWERMNPRGPHTWDKNCLIVVIKFTPWQPVD